jgi:hypothetical protein
MFTNTSALNIGAPNFIGQTLLDIKGQIGPDTITVDSFNTSSHKWVEHLASPKN